MRICNTDTSKFDEETLIESVIMEEKKLQIETYKKEWEKLYTKKE